MAMLSSLTMYVDHHDAILGTPGVLESLLVSVADERLIPQVPFDFSCLLRVLFRVLIAGVVVACVAHPVSMAAAPSPLLQTRSSPALAASHKGRESLEMHAELPLLPPS